MKIHSPICCVPVKCLSRALTLISLTTIISRGVPVKWLSIEQVRTKWLRGRLSEYCHYNYRLNLCNFLRVILPYSLIQSARLFLNHYLRCVISQNKKSTFKLLQRCLCIELRNGDIKHSGYRYAYSAQLTSWRKAFSLTQMLCDTGFAFYPKLHILITRNMFSLE